MAFIPVPDTVMAELRMAINGQQVENTLYFQKEGGWNVPGATQLANDLLVWWTTLLSVQLSEQLVLREVTVSDLNVVDSFQVTVPAPTPNPSGGVVGEAEPNNVSLTVSFRTGLRGRSFRGRNYVVGIPKEKTLNSQVISTFSAYMQGSYQGIPSAITLSGGTWVVASRFHANAPRVTGVSTPVTAVVVVDDFVDSQRRRLPGRGT